MLTQAPFSTSNFKISLCGKPPWCKYAYDSGVLPPWFIHTYKQSFIHHSFIHSFIHLGRQPEEESSTSIRSGLWVCVHAMVRYSQPLWAHPKHLLYHVGSIDISSTLKQQRHYFSAAAHSSQVQRRLRWLQRVLKRKDREVGRHSTVLYLVSLVHIGPST
jgi:hypothetical protein